MNNNDSLLKKKIINLVLLLLLIVLFFLVSKRMEDVGHQHALDKSTSEKMKPPIRYPNIEPSPIPADKVIDLVNSERTKLGLSSLMENNQLATAAKMKAQDMCEKDYWAHVSPDGDTPWKWIKDSDFDYTLAGENLARDFDNVYHLVSNWMASPTHRENIVNRHYQFTGVAVLKCDSYQGYKTTIVVQLFAQKISRELKESTKSTKDVDNQQLGRDTPIHCNVNDNCGGGTIPLKQWECEQSTCCQMANHAWVFYKDKAACSADQAKGL